LRISEYQRLSLAGSQAELEKLGGEMRDRFGVLPGEVESLLGVLLIKQRLGKIRATGLVAAAKEGRALITLQFSEKGPLDPARLIDLCAKNPANYKLSPTGKLYISFDAQPDSDIGWVTLATSAIAAL
jgi:transcription-repair coupling factor (superfamily II helicase)